MPYQVECQCGQRIEVEAWSAGGTVPCTCGSQVSVPLLSDLRRAAGLDAYPENPARKIERMRAVGELPVGDTCARCDDPTDDVLDLVAECETAWATQHVGESRVVGVIVVSGLPIPIPVAEMEEGETKGQALTVCVPVRLCRACRRPLPKPWVGPGLLAVEVGTFLAAWALVCALSPWALLLLPAAALVWCFDRRLRRREQGYLQGVLREVPVYRELLERYPSAVIRPG